MLVLKGIYHYWTYFCFFPGDKNANGGMPTPQPPTGHPSPPFSGAYSPMLWTDKMHQSVRGQSIQVVQDFVHSQYGRVSFSGWILPKLHRLSFWLSLKTHPKRGTPHTNTSPYLLHRLDSYLIRLVQSLTACIRLR